MSVSVSENDNKNEVNLKPEHIKGEERGSLGWQGWDRPWRGL